MNNNMLKLIVIGLFSLFTLSSVAYASAWLSIDPGTQHIGSYSTASWTVHTGNGTGCNENDMTIAVKYDTAQGGWTAYTGLPACTGIGFSHHYPHYNGDRFQLWEAFKGQTPPSPPEVQINTKVIIN